MLAVPIGQPLATLIGDTADLISAVAWPAVVVGALWFLRDPLGALARRIATQTQRVEIGGFAVDLSTTVEQVPDQGTTALASVRRPDSAFRVNDSTAAGMLEELRRAGDEPYLLVDVGEGREWLSSRLYLFAILLARARGTRAFCFVETTAGVRGRFVGLAAPEAVRWALAKAYPWLEADYAAAYAQATTLRRSSSGTGREPLVLDHSGRPAGNLVQDLVNHFLQAVQSRPAAPQADPTTGDQDWVTEQQPAGQLNEHAAWLAGADLERVLGPSLERFAYIREDTPRPAGETGVAALRLHGHDLVALVDDQHRFRGTLVNRRDALEIVAEQFGPAGLDPGSPRARGG